MTGLQLCVMYCNHDRFAAACDVLIVTMTGLPSQVCVAGVIPILFSVVYVYAIPRFTL